MDRRRTSVPFDPFFFEKQQRDGRSYSLRETFERIYTSNHWSGPDSVSGAGASDDQTAQLRQTLPELLASLGAEVLLDLPCGDGRWMQQLELPIAKYIGADIVAELVETNQRRYSSPDREFLLLDLTRDALPPADVLLCRDCLVHFSFADIRRALANIRANPITYLLTTTFPLCATNEEITTGDWRVLNFQAAPFDFPPPLALLNESCSEGDGLFTDKSLGLWRVADLPG
ncbi:MAG: class I SAM-dependent methyltransferase [Chloroflexi bacterium]|nr:class I SAM-dependent methyltransferase [Chloroflexota bacterium]